MTAREKGHLNALRLCDLYNTRDGEMYRPIGDAADIFVVAKPDGRLSLGSPVKPPCKKDCPRRTVGCHAQCPDWDAYVKRRDEEYEKRADVKRVNDAIQDGYRRIAGR